MEYLNTCLNPDRAFLMPKTKQQKAYRHVDKAAYLRIAIYCRNEIDSTDIPWAPSIYETILRPIVS